jgi:tetratricopeptide (TPR) repeat protein
MGRLDLAIADCDAALEREPALASAYLVRGRIHLEQGDYQAAAADFAQALELDPACAAAYLLRGQTAWKRGDLPAAIADFTESLRLQPNDAQTLFLRGSVYGVLGKDEAALADLNQAVLRDLQYTAAYCAQRAIVHAAREEYEAALADYGIVLHIDPTNVTALNGREHVLLAIQDRDKRKHMAATTQVARLNKETQEMPAEAIEEAVEDYEGDVELIPDEPAPPTEGEPATAEDPAETPPISNDATSKGDKGEKPHGPIEARAAKIRRDAEMQERAARWALMRERFNKEDTEKQQKKRKETKESKTVGSKSNKRLVLAIVGVVVLLLGGGAAIFFVLNRETKVTADEVYAEFSKNNAAANERFKGKFIQIRGKLTTFTTEKKVEQLIFEGGGDVKWHIVVPGGPQTKELKAGQEVTIRGRLMPRKEDADLQIGNCTIVK